MAAPEGAQLFELRKGFETKRRVDSLAGLKELEKNPFFFASNFGFRQRCGDHGKVFSPISQPVEPPLYTTPSIP